jgi:hypothetical protein
MVRLHYPRWVLWSACLLLTNGNEKIAVQSGAYPNRGPVTE